MAKLFDKIQLTRPKLNKFDLSHERKMSLNFDALYPILVQEILPGDSFQVHSQVMLRMAPLLAPVMHRVNVTVHYFFVPNRIVWDEWEPFITGGREGTDAPIYPHFIPADDIKDNGALGIGSLYDFMGLPTIESGAPAITQPTKISALAFRAYQLIYDEYYRDQNLQAPLDISKASGQITGAELTKILTRRTRCWEKDYFTSALPTAQRGPDVLMPFEADINYLETSKVAFGSGSTPPPAGPLETETGDTEDLKIKFQTGPDLFQDIRIENIESIENATTTINELRTGFRLQEWLERMARGGARYAEQLFSMFGVKSDDARLQRPEYLGGGRQPVVISEVLSTYQDPAGAGDPQANMAGHGFSLGRTNQFSKRFKEHGHVIGIISVLPKTAYQQGINRMWTRNDKLDYAWPQLAHLGEQEIQKKELYFDYVTTGTGTTWGYQSRYAEYKYACDTVHGDFRDSLAFWHMGRIFDSLPELNEAFVRANATKRIFAVDDAPSVLYAQIYNKVSALRPLPYFGTPMF